MMFSTLLLFSNTAFFLSTALHTFQCLRWIHTATPEASTVTGLFVLLKEVASWCVYLFHQQPDGSQKYHRGRDAVTCVYMYNHSYWSWTMQTSRSYDCDSGDTCASCSERASSYVALKLRYLTFFPCHLGTKKKISITGWKKQNTTKYSIASYRCSD